MNIRELRCLEALRDLTSPHDCSVPFAVIEDETGYDRRMVRRAVRELAAKGYARYTRGLCDEDGRTAGSGYRITEAGLDALPQSENELFAENYILRNENERLRKVLIAICNCDPKDCKPVARKALEETAP